MYGIIVYEINLNLPQHLKETSRITVFYSPVKISNVEKAPTIKKVSHIVRFLLNNGLSIIGITK